MTCSEAGRSGGLARNPNKGRRISEATWQEIRLRWHSGEATQAELAAEYGISRRHLYRRVHEGFDG